MRGVLRLHMGPVEGRDPGIRNLIASYAANLHGPGRGIQDAVVHGGAPAPRRTGMRPSRAVEKAVRLLINDEVQEHFMLFVKPSSVSLMRPSGDLELSEQDAVMVEEIAGGQ